jgi:hypothetical protein
MLDDKILGEIEELSSLLFTQEEISIITNVKIENMNFENSVESRAFQKGRLQTKVILRKAVLEMAKNGSSEAIKIVESIFQKLEVQNNRRKP